MSPLPPADHLAKAARFLGAAEHLLRGGFQDSATQEGYYAALHGTLALLATEGLSAETHKGARQLLAHAFVRTGRLPSDHARLLARLMADREVAGYGVTGEIDPEGGKAVARELVRFMRPVLALLRESAPEGTRMAEESLAGLARAADAD